MSGKRNGENKPITNIKIRRKLRGMVIQFQREMSYKNK